MVRRTKFDLAEAEKRAHILEGFKIALDHIDEIVALIKASANVEKAREGLMATFRLSEIQANAILEMRLSRLTGLERKKIEDEYLEVIQLIEKLRAILDSPAQVLTIIKDELGEIKERFGDERRTEIVAASGDFEIEDLIAEEDVVITISHAGYIKRLPVTTLPQPAPRRTRRHRRRNPRGRLHRAPLHRLDPLLHPRLHRPRPGPLAQGPRDSPGRTHREGKAIVNMVEMSQQERVAAVVPVKVFQDDRFVFLVTRGGTVKKTALSAYSNPRRGGIVAIGVDPEDALIDAVLDRRHAGHHPFEAKRQGDPLQGRPTSARWGAPRSACAA